MPKFYNISSIGVWSIVFTYVVIPTRYAYSQDTTPPFAPRVEAMEREFDAGTVTEKIRVSHQFTFRNVGNSDLEILSVKSSCGCLYELPEQRIIPHGSTSWLRINYDLADKETGTYSEVVLLETNDPVESMIEFAIRVNLVAPLTVDPETLSFTSEEIQLGTSKIVAVLKRGRGTKAHIDNISVYPEQAFAVHQIKAEKSSEEERIQFSVTPAPHLLDTTLASITFETNLVSLPFLEIPVILETTPSSMTPMIESQLINAMPQNQATAKTIVTVGASFIAILVAVITARRFLISMRHK